MSEIKGLDASSNAPLPSSNNKFVGGKPKLSILSTKQAGIRLNSDDQPEQQPIIPSIPTNDYQGIFNPADVKDDIAQIPNVTSSKHLATQQNFNEDSSIDEARGLNRENSTGQDFNKMNLSKEDLVRLIHLLKHDLHSKEIALAAIKCEQLKRLLNPVEISRSSLATTYLKLQDRLKAHDRNNNKKSNNELNSENSSSASNKSHIKGGFNGTDSRTSNSKREQDNDESEIEKESLDILNTLIELLDGHPLLALPRDSIYCLDYNCNELSTKNYLNLKIQHLDNLINQHRRFRFCMNERLRQSEKRCVDMARELELERKLKYENQTSQFKKSGKAILLKQIEQMRELMDKERKDKEAIVMTLLNDLLDSKEQIETLTSRLALLEMNNKNSHKMMEERQKEFRREKSEEVGEFKRQSALWTEEKLELQTKIKKLESENLSMKETLKGCYKNMSTSSVATKETIKSSSNSPVSPTKPGNISGKAPALVSRAGSNKPTPPVKNVTGTMPASSASAVSSRGAVVGQNGNLGSTTTNLTNSSPVRQVSGASTTANSSKAISSGTGRIATGSVPTTDHSAYRIPPLFKSTSLSSTQQPVKRSSNPMLISQQTQSSTSSHSTSSSMTSATTSTVGVTRSFSVTGTSNKPQVPAKPAQLLDHQRQSLS